MYKYQISLKVRYGEVDSMGVVYYGNYAQYFEVARVETIRSLGLSYKEIEDQGIILPVTKYSVKFIRPATYDDEIFIESTIPFLPNSYKMEFQQKIFLPKKYGDTPLTIADISLYILDKSTKKPTMLPKETIDKLSEFYN